MSGFVVAAARPVLAIVVVRATTATVLGQPRTWRLRGAVDDDSSNRLPDGVTVENQRPKQRIRLGSAEQF